MTEYQERQLIANSRKQFELTQKLLDRIEELEQRLEPFLPKRNVFLNIHQASKKMGYCEAHVTKMCRNGELPFATKVGKQWRIPEAELIKYIGNM